ncbi:acyloxyacyl hydrolase [Qipengyuania vesicularis]|uniref:acyloxyacyl hydrolase n=1 Tax=Qipengyuania vesicularis TaxID=2867232 RepID=UPI001C880418|nr:acyloxyacyl hydrolase [Qipengyuania vesicularis]MBX7528472.1 acyloxyacyl hydrolase [Qipengyuania vesicularis]
MRRFFATLSIVAAAFGLSSPAQAQEIFTGLYVHGVDTPLSLDIGEDGMDVQAGYRFAPIDAVGGMEPYIIASANMEGDTSFAGAGVSWKLEMDDFYLRPGIGLVVHDGPTERRDPDTQIRNDLGSRVLFQPEIALGFNVSERVSIEASWIHISNANVFDRGQNPGIDMMGLRINLRM